MNRPTGKQQGLASVELAMVTPFLLIMMLMSAEFTRVFYEFNTLTKSVRDAARWAATDAYDGTNQFDLTGAKIQQAKNIAVYGSVGGGGTPVLSGLGVGDVTVAQFNTGAAPAIQEHVRVTGTYSYTPFAPVLRNMGFLSQDFNLNFTLVARSTMRAL